jgi:hypothetical protein
MRFCEECNNKFSFLDRLKSIPKDHGELKCRNCNAVYRQKSNIYKGIFGGLVFFIYLNNQDYLRSLIRFTDNILIEGIILVFFTVVSSFVFDLIPHRWQKYERYE